MQWVGIDKVKKADGTTLEMGDALVALSTGTILDGAVTNAKLASTAVTESVTVPGTFTTASLSATAGILGTQLANTTVTGSKITNSTITNGKLAANAVTESVTAAGTFTTASLNASANIAGTQLAAAAAIAGTQIAANTIAESNITAKTITHASLSDTAGVLGSQLGAGTVHSIRTTVTWNGAATQAIGTLPAGAVLLQALAVCTTAFDGTGPSPAVTVGYTAAQTAIIPTCTLTLNAVTGETASALGADLYASSAKKVKFYAAQTVVNGYLTAGGGASAGALDVILIYVQTA